MSLPADYAERVYAGVLGKIIGVYLGRPFEGWEHERIERELGEVWDYVHERLGQPLIVTDDDISGTFTFLRALEDYADPTAAEIGETWLNYLVEERAVLWWGGMGMSTEHTAYLRLKNGIPAPLSGSIKFNGQVVAEQIGAQIFIDGWGLIWPGDSVRAAEYARRAASVSHDGEAIYGAQMVAAMVALAFVETDVAKLIEGALAVIPSESLTAKLISDVREWHADGLSWREGFRRIKERYGYDKYGGNCHIIPNHALIIHALLHGGGDFGKSLIIVNTCGWDTDCNSGNVGCIMGVLGGLARIPAHLRDPVRDRMYLPTADGGRCITDALGEAYRIVGYAQRLHGLPAEIPTGRFHFSLRGSVQGFSQGANLDGKLVFEDRTSTPTFIPPDARKMPGYGMLASPTLYPGQTVRASVSGSGNAALFIGYYDAEDQISYSESEPVDLGDSARELTWLVPETGGFPICEVGVKRSGPSPLNPPPPKGEGDRMLLEWLTWDGEPGVRFRRAEGKAWREAWVNGVSEWPNWGSAFRVIQNDGTGLLITGTREWSDYRVSATVRPHLAQRAGIAARVQGMKRWYALLLNRNGAIELVKNDALILDEKPFPWSFGEEHLLEIEVVGPNISCFANGDLLFTHTDNDPMLGGGVAFVIEDGRMDSEEMVVRNA
ncbi:MAG: ADP-ribosylglycohydrolase family protein [Fimbriimonas sp.]